MWQFVRKHWLIMLSIIYLLSPIDIIPEMIVGPLGITDDIGVLGALVFRELWMYWKSRQSASD